MTAKKARRVVIINDIKSDMIEQAIFILKSNDLDQLPQAAGSNLVAEAQNIINSYIGTLERSTVRLKKKGSVARFLKLGAVRRVLYVLAGVCAVAAVIATSTLIIDFVVKASNIG